ncbi:hypothetical protein AB4Y36_38170 [Paraburkholderia sp. BR10936]|uniref:hypothetical protein n=1 Tax=Paraburkholderia sp. BR10936 TaxID=3236993 RepID=UPI0034D24E75
MKDVVYIGASPASEHCAQVGTADYSSHARLQCRAFINLIRRELGDEPEGARLGIKGESHEFGTYYEVVCWYDDEDAAATNYAYDAERSAPDMWDAAALEELAGAGVEVHR